jgi:hypothetical protein
MAIKQAMELRRQRTTQILIGAINKNEIDQNPTPI